MIPPEDVYYKKTVPLRLPGVSARFRVSQSLFSSHAIDDGTRLLLRSIIDAHAGSGPVLDLGCGYGPVGITLGLLDPHRRVVMLDRDALAVSYARQNAALNGIALPDVRGALGYDDLSEDEKFGLIALNLPAKAGAPVIRHLLLGAAPHLEPAGTVAIVAVEPLAPLVLDTLHSEPAVRIVYQTVTRGYLVAHYQFDAAPRSPAPHDAFAAGIYNRALIDFDAGGHSVALQTLYGLPEFDTPSFATQLLLHELAAIDATPSPRVAILNPGQGHVPVALHALAQPDAIALLSRDLLSLRTTHANLIRNGCVPDRITLLHHPGFPAPPTRVDLIAGIVREDEGPDAIAATVDAAATTLAQGGIILLAMSSTAAARLTKTLRVHRALHVTELRRKKGTVALRIARHGEAPLPSSEGAVEDSPWRGG